MPMETLGSEAVRTSWGATLDKAHAGTEIVVERHNQPVVSVVNHEWLQALKRKVALVNHPALLEAQMRAVIKQLGDQIAAEADANDSWISGEDFLAQTADLYGQAFVDAALTGDTDAALDAAQESGAINVAG